MNWLRGREVFYTPRSLREHLHKKEEELGYMALLSASGLYMKLRASLNVLVRAFK